MTTNDQIDKEGQGAKLENLEARLIANENAFAVHEQRFQLLHTCIEGLLQVTHKLNIYIEEVNKQLPKTKQVDIDKLFPDTPKPELVQEND